MYMPCWLYASLSEHLAVWTLLALSGYPDPYISPLPVQFLFAGISRTLSRIVSFRQDCRRVCRKAVTRRFVAGHRPAHCW